MPIAVRPVETTDLPQIVALLNRIIAIGGTTALETPVTMDTCSHYYITGDDLICCHVALDDQGRVAGFQWLGHNPELPENCADIASFARAEPKIKGVGRALFPVTVQVARDRGFEQINATIRADNTQGLGYYSRMGFEDHSITPAVPLSDGRLVDRISKRYVLSEE